LATFDVGRDEVAERVIALKAAALLLTLSEIVFLLSA
jgi:hypothetical protein